MVYEDDDDFDALDYLEGGDGTRKRSATQRSAVSKDKSQDLEIGKQWADITNSDQRVSVQRSEAGDEKPAVKLPRSVGRDYDREERERRVEAARKADPRFYAERKEVLFVRDAQYFIENASMSGVTKQLFGPFWLEREVAVLYGKPGGGKSALAMQIAESLARGLSLAPWGKPGEPLAVGPQKVLYIDFELTRLQLAQRYAVRRGEHLRHPYQLSPNLKRAEMYWDGRLPDGYADFTDMLFEDIVQTIDEHGSTILILDNITFLTRGTTASSTTAFRLMKRLQELRTERFMSVLVIAHTVKHSDTRKFTNNDLQGSIDLAKIADSMFVLAPSCRQGGLVYLKQIKTRTGQKEHGDDNVAVFKRHKFDLGRHFGTDSRRAANFLGFDFVAFDNEERHLGETHHEVIRRTRQLNSGTIQAAQQLASDGMSVRKVAARLGLAPTTAFRYLRQSRNARQEVRAA